MTFVFLPSFLFGRGRESLGGFYLVEGREVMTCVSLPRFLFGRGRERDDLCVSSIFFFSRGMESDDLCVSPMDSL